MIDEDAAAAALNHLASLAGTWSREVREHPAADDVSSRDEFSRRAGFNSALEICAEQLRERLASLRADLLSDDA
jgi:hypothetical protein